MSGLLDRMAARASGAPNSVTPRVPARFEGDPLPELDEVSLRVTGRPSEPGARDITTPGRTEPGTPTSSSPRGPRRETPVAAPVRSEPSRSGRPARSEPTRAGPEPRALTTDLDRDARRPAADPATRVVVPPAVPSATVTPAAAIAVPVSHRTAAPEVGVRGPDVVHVSIGRIDVRASANVPTTAAAPRPAANRAAAGEPLSLQDYLRGRREAR